MSPALSRRALPIRAAVLLLTLAAGCATGHVAPQPVSPAASTRYALVPLPRRLVPGTGELRLDRDTRIALSDPADSSLRVVADLLVVPLRAASGLPLPITALPANGAEANTIAIRLDAPAPTTGPTAESESYHLVVTSRGAVLSARTLAGLVDGVATLRQLLPAALERTVRSTSPWAADSSRAVALAAEAPTAWAIPAVDIEDAPRFRYRGILLDVARYYFPMSFLEKLVDEMALYKFDVLQLHLTDDQGWRLEIRKYPRLTEVGAWRKETQIGSDGDKYVGDGKPTGGFYTQAQIRQLVAYAAARHITIVPEIEMPGHAGAALAAYPELACTAGPFEVSTRWGVHEDIFCPSEKTFGFLEDVLTEVMELFPSQYIHVGGDEVPKTRWKASPLAQDLMRREGLKNEEELQSYFIKRIERFLSAHGRRLIGWDEILEGGIAPEATVMSWRGIEGGIAAAQQGHDVIMTPTDYAYLDQYQGDRASEPLAIGGYLPFDSVYAWNPAVPARLTAEQAAHVIGAQGNLWTEHVATPAHAEYMLFPRMLAMSEVFWTPQDERRWDDFVTRVPAQLARLDALGVNYRVPEPDGLVAERRVIEDHAGVALSTFVPGAVIRYTVDGSTPTSSSPRYTRPLDIRVGSSPVIVSARSFLPDGRTSSVVRERIARAEWKPALGVNAASLRPGLAYTYAEGTFAAADDVTTMAPTRVGTVAQVALRGDERPEQYGEHFAGFLRVPEDALYTFYLASDDGAKLRIDGDVVIDHDGQHDATEKQGGAALRAGVHRIDVVYFQAGGGAELRLAVSAPHLPKQVVPSEWLAHAPPPER